MRDQFGEELEEVLAERLADAAGQNWLSLLKVALIELMQLPGVYLREGLKRQRHTGEGRLMMARVGSWFEENRAQTPWGATLIGLVPFLVTPLIALGEWLLKHGLLDWIGASSLNAVYQNLFYILMGVYMLVLVAGWVRGFPAWVYPYAIQFVFMSFLVSYDFATAFAHIESRIIQNLLTLICVLGLYGIIAGAALLLTRKQIKRPIQAGWDGLSQDIARVSFGLFGLAPFMLRMMFDGLHNDMGWMLARDLLLAVGALVFFRTRREGIGISAMLVTIILAYSVTAVNLAFYWNIQQVLNLPDASNAFQNLRTVLTCAVPIIIFTFGPWWVQRISQPHPD